MKRYGVTDAIRNVIADGGIPELVLSLAVLLLLFGSLLAWSVILWAAQP